MSSRDYDYDDAPRRSHRHRERRDDREPRYVETQETYVRAPAGQAPLVPEPPYTSRTTDLVRRPVREDSDLSVEEVRRDFPPPGGAYVNRRSMARDDRYGPVRSRSAERSAYGDYDSRDARSRKSETYLKTEVEPRRRSLSRNQKIIAAVGGAALAVGGKELWDRRQAGSDGRPISRNPLASAAVGAAGAFAGYEGAELYAKRFGKNGEVKEKTYSAHRGRDGELSEYYSETEEQPKKSRRKSIVEGALGLAGLGAAAKAIKGGDDRDKSRGRHGSPDSYKSGKSRGRGKSQEGPAKFQQAAKAALLAGATEAFRVRKEPGGWGGAKGKRILTAAIGAGGIDAAADRDPDKKSKRHILEAVVGGLAGNRLINGSRNNVAEDDRRSRSRSRARSRSRGGGDTGVGSGAGLAALATAGLGALAGKKLLDRSRSRGPDNRRRGSPDSYDSRSPSPRRDKHKRNKSVSDYARKGLASLGLGGAAAAADDDRRSDRHVREVEETTVHRRRRRSPRSDSDSDRRPRYSSGRGDVYGDPRHADSRSSNVGSRRGGESARARDGKKNRRVAEGKQSASSSDLGSSTDDEKRIKKMKGKQLITAGLATVATIHAAHNIYQSMEKRDARHKAVAEGEMSPEEARKLKAKATLQDAASVGIAALGIKGAISEIKEANEMRKETAELRVKKEERHKKRLERQKKSSSQPSSSSGSNGGRRRVAYDHPSSPQAPAGTRYNYGPRYVDSNPYSADTLPAPPVGYNGR
jgi:hypothetical protein